MGDPQPVNQSCTSKLNSRFETHFLRKELTDETVHVLIGTTLPGGIGMGEEEVSPEVLGDPLMLSELLAIVGRQRMNTGRKRRQQGDHRIRDRLRCLERHMGNQRIAGRALVERDKCLLMAGADDQISLPVAEATTLSHNGGAQINGDLIGNHAASLTDSVTLPARLLAAQGAMHGATSALVGIDTLIDGLVADGGLCVGFEVAGDLLRTPRLCQLGINNGPCFCSNARAVLTGPHASL